MRIFIRSTHACVFEQGILLDDSSVDRKVVVVATFIDGSNGCRDFVSGFAEGPVYGLEALLSQPIKCFGLGIENKWCWVVKYGKSNSVEATASSFFRIFGAERTCCCVTGILEEFLALCFEVFV